MMERSGQEERERHDQEVAEANRARQIRQGHISDEPKEEEPESEPESESESEPEAA